MKLVRLLRAGGPFPRGLCRDWNRWLDHVAAGGAYLQRPYRSSYLPGPPAELAAVLVVIDDDRPLEVHLARFEDPAEAARYRRMGAAHA